MALSDYADWWDKQKAQSEKILQDWVDENPQWWAVAATVQTSMDLGQGLVDALRFGQGVAEGGWRGYGKDAMRLLVLLGPLGRAGGMLSRFLNANMIRFAVTTKGVTGPCTFTAANNAMNIVSGPGRNLFLTARDAAKALGKTLGQVATEGSKYKIGAWIDDLIPFLRSQGAKIRSLTNISRLEDAINAAKNENGVVVFAIKYTTQAGKVIKHSVIAVRDGLGRVRFADYGGKLFGSLEELVARWGAPNAQGISLMSRTSGPGAVVFDGLELTGLMEDAMSVFKGGAFFIEGVTAIETQEEGVDLAVPVVIAAVPAPNQAGGDKTPPDVVKESFNAYKARRSGKPVLRMPEIKIVGHVAPRSDWLTGVQYRLNAAGFGAGPVDGILGPKTRQAIRKFQETYQQSHRLRVDAVPGPETQAALVSICGY
jgi:hypothetical protein